MPETRPYPRPLPTPVVAAIAPKPPGLDVLAINPEVPVSTQVLKDATERHREDLVGLTLEIANKTSRSDPDTTSKRYVVSDCGAMIRPRKEYRPSGRPRPYRLGHSFQFGRKPELHEFDAVVRAYTIHKYNSSTGEIEDVYVASPKQLESLMDGDNTVGVGWESEPDAEHTASEEVHLSIAGDGVSVFGAISKQLEDRKVYNWGGLSWRHGGNKLEIVEEVSLTYRKGLKAKPIRTFVVKECDEHGLPISQHVLKDAALKDYFEENKADISNLSLKILEEPEDIDAAERDAMKDRARAVLEGVITDEMDDAPESIGDEDKIAAWLLSYADIIDFTGEDKEADKKKLSELLEFTDKTEGKRRIKALKEIIDEHGLVTVFELAGKLKNDFLVAALTLRLPTTFHDTTKTIETDGRSISWAIEGLADKYYYAKHEDETEEQHAGLEFTNPFDDSVEAAYRQREIVDQRAGSALVSETLQIAKTPEVAGVEDKQLIYEMREKVMFNNKPPKNLQDLIKEQAAEVEKKIYGDVEAKKTTLQADLTLLGRLLRRSIGQ